MKTSVFIPCIPAHYCLLDRVIDAYLSAEEWPDEIVIVVSDANKINPEYFEVLKKEFEQCNFKLTIHPVPVLLYTGEACNLVKDLCDGDVIIIQAADDLPHRERVAVVKRFFGNYDILSLNHSFWGLGDIVYYGMDELERRTKNKLENIKVVQPHEIKEHVSQKPHDVYGQFCGFKVAAGTVCYRKELARDHKWSSAPKGQDTIFCKEVILKYNKSIIIDTPLYYYYK